MTLDFRALAARAGRALLPCLAVALALAFVYGPTLLGHARLSADPWVFADDVRVLIHPQFRDEDPALFPGDPIVAYYLASLPDAYALVYRVFGPLAGVAALSKLLPYVLLAFTLFCLGATARRLGGTAALFGALALALGSPYVLGRMVGGLPRGFALPLLAAGTFCLVSGRARLLAVCVVLAAGFYPVAGLELGAMLAGLLLLPRAQRGDASTWSLGRRATLVSGTAVVAGLVLLRSVWRLRGWGSAIGPALVPAYPEAGPFGRFDAVDRPPFPALPRAAVAPLRAALIGDGEAIVRCLDGRAHSTWLVPLVSVLAAVALGWLACRRVEARRCLLLPAAVVLCHTASLLVEPRLFLPERHVAYAVPVLALVAVPCLAAPLATGAAWRRALPWVANVALVVLLGARGVSWSGLTVHVPPEERPLYGAVAALPVNALVAGFPGETTDSIPYLSRRSVFLARETHMPFHTRYTELMRARAHALFHAYFTSSPETLRALRDREGVTHLLLDRRNFVTRPGYFAPFDAELAREFDAGRASGFAALTLAPKLAVFEQGPFVLLDLRRL